MSVDQVLFCGELLFFSSSFFFFFLSFFLLFFPSLSLSPGMGSVTGRAHFLPITLFFLPFFSPSFTFFFPLLFCPTLIYFSHCPPAFHFILFSFLFSSVNLSKFFFSSPVHQSTFITIPRSQIMSLTYIYNQC